MHLNLLLSDYLLYGILILLALAVIWSRRYPHWREPWQNVFRNKLGACAAVILFFYVLIGLIDSIHFQSASLLDLLLKPLGNSTEITYAAPFSKPLSHTKSEFWDILKRIAMGGILATMSYWLVSKALFKKLTKKKQNSEIAWPAMQFTFFVIWILIWILAFLIKNYHVLGTDQIGRDIFYLTIKSIRTGLIIGTLTTLFALPFALFLGTMAGYFGGWIDDLIQYIYITLSSIPGILLIAASVLMLEIYIGAHANSFPSLIKRADVRLVALCLILAITGWASLCRFLRGETLKLRELEYIQASRALGTPDFVIILRHIIPNVFHIVLITIALDFSGLVLAESVLSYLGIGVDPVMISWGNMINSSRLELAREPVVWWPLLGALIAMFGLVLSANLFADAVRDAFDPHLRIAKGIR